MSKWIVRKYQIGILNALAISGLTVLVALTTNMTPAMDIQGWSGLMFERLAGRPATQDELTHMTDLVTSQQLDLALAEVTNKPDFFNITIRTFCEQMSTRAERPNEWLNDFTASCMG